MLSHRLRAAYGETQAPCNCSDGGGREQESPSMNSVTIAGNLTDVFPSVHRWYQRDGLYYLFLDASPCIFFLKKENVSTTT